MASFLTKLVLLAVVVCLAKAQGGPYPPGHNTDEAPPPPENNQRLGFRCPFPPDENGQWPAYCHDVIGPRCQCMNDDIHYSQRDCVSHFGRDYYERRLTSQMHLERERGESIDYLWDCYDAVEGMVSGGDNGFETK